MKNAIIRGDLIDKAAMTRGIEHVISACANIIEASSLSPVEKRDLQTNLASWPIVVEGVVKKQTREAARAGANKSAIPKEEEAGVEA